MKIDGLNNVTGGYQGQGSSVSTTQTQSASADTRTATQDAKQPVITESSDNVREASDNDGKIVIREEGTNCLMNTKIGRILDYGK